MGRSKVSFDKASQSCDPQLISHTFTFEPLDFIVTLEWNEMRKWFWNINFISFLWKFLILTLNLFFFFALSLTLFEFRTLDKFSISAVFAISICSFPPLMNQAEDWMQWVGGERFPINGRKLNVLHPTVIIVEHFQLYAYREFLLELRLGKVFCTSRVKRNPRH